MTEASSANLQMAIALPLGVVSNQLMRIEADLRLLNMKALDFGRDRKNGRESQTSSRSGRLTRGSGAGRRRMEAAVLREVMKADDRCGNPRGGADAKRPAWAEPIRHPADNRRSDRCAPECYGQKYRHDASPHDGLGR
jgi:hypothetical protein